MNFAYQARDGSGRLRDGEIAAAGPDEAALQLRKEGLYPIALREAAASASQAASSFGRRRVTRSEVIYVTNQLSVMVDAGVPLAAALGGISKQSVNPTLREILDKVGRQVEGGENLSAALARFPRHFDATYVNLVKASEASGSLGKMLERIALQLRNELETRQKVTGALLYPAAMLLMCVGVSVFLLAYVFPKLAPMFATRRMELPRPTLLMMGLSEAICGYWYLFIAGAAALAGGVVWARRLPWGRRALDRMWIHLPILGPMLRKVAISRSLRTLATTINAGVPMLESLQLGAGVSGNVHYEESWKAVSREVSGGRQIHESLEGDPLFPPTLPQMIASGESTGRLGQVLVRVSDYYDREVDVAIKSATSLIEPIMVAAMGCVIGTIALAMLLPIFRLSSHTG